jgi:hypothetical protein
MIASRAAYGRPIPSPMPPAQVVQRLIRPWPRSSATWPGPVVISLRHPAMAAACSDDRFPSMVSR